MPRAKLLGLFLLTSWSSSASVGCGGSPAVVPLPPTQWVPHREANLPPLFALEREGDPYAALAAAVVLPAGAHTNRALAAAAVRDLEQRGFMANARSNGSALIVGVLLPQDSEGLQAAAALRRALLQAPLQQAHVGQDTSEAPPPQPFDACGGVDVELGAARARAAIGQLNTRLAAVGNAETLAHVAEEYAQGPAWPEGNAVDASWPDQDRFVAQRGPGELDVLHLALLTGDTRRALAADRALIRRDSTFRLLGAALNPPWHVHEVSTALLPGGACLTAQLHTTAPSNARAAAEAVSVLGREMTRSLLRTASAPTAALAAPAAANPRDAAMSAAWAMLTQESAQAAPDPTRDRWRVTLTTSSSHEEDLAARVREFTPGRLPLLHATERGQGRMWALLGSPCPTDHEAPQHAGHTFAALVAAARWTIDDPRVLLEPWSDGRRLGLLASVPADAEAPVELLAQSLSRAALGSLHQPTHVAQVRQDLLRDRPPVEGWVVALGLASGGQPSRLAPEGVPSTLQTLSATRAEAALRGFFAGPVQLAVLGNVSDSQAKHLQARLLELLAPFGTGKVGCSPAAPPVTLSGQFFLSDPALAEESGAGTPGARLEQAPVQHWLVYPTRAVDWENSYWVAQLLNGSDGWLSRSVRAAGLIASGQAYALGGGQNAGALVIALQSPRGSVEAALDQTRSLLERLGQSGVSDAGWRKLAARALPRTRLLDPRVRLGELLAPPPAPPDPGKIRTFMHEQLGSERLIIVRSDGAASSG